VVGALVNALAAQPNQVALVLDAYHLIQAAAVHHSLASLLERRPVQLRLARLRARGQLVELRERDLRFTPGEAGQLLQEMVGPDLPEEAVAALAARTEAGSPGYSWRRCRCRGHTDPVGFVASFVGSHRHVLDYLTEEVLARQPDHLVRFLLATSVLERLCGPLCQAVTGRADSQGLLEQVERAACSWCRWMRCAAGGAFTSCSPTCSAPASLSSRPTAA
jgi:LuxR family maltose regulon positive regulatory protein